MMTTNLFVVANVKQLRTDGSFRILLPFFWTSWGVGVLNSAIFNNFHSWVEFGKILEGLRNFGEGVWTPPQPPLHTPLPIGKLVVAYLFKKFYSFYGNRPSITVRSGRTLVSVGIQMNPFQTRHYISLGPSPWFYSVFYVSFFPGVSFP